MAIKDVVLIGMLVILAFVLTACNEPRRTPDGHLMDRPPVAAYGDNVTTHDMSASDDESDAGDGE